MKPEQIRNVLILKSLCLVLESVMNGVKQTPFYKQSFKNSLNSLMKEIDKENTQTKIVFPVLSEERATMDHLVKLVESFSYALENDYEDLLELGKILDDFNENRKEKT